MKKSVDKIPLHPFKNQMNGLGLEVRKLCEFLDLENPGIYETPHRCDFYVIIFISKGQGLHSINFNDIHYQEGSLIFIAKNRIHAFTRSRDEDGFVLLFSEEFLNQNQIKFHDLAYSYPFNLDLYDAVLNPGLNKDTFSSLFDCIYNEYQSPFSQHSNEILQCLLRSLLLKIRVIGNEQSLLNDRQKKNSTKLFVQFQILLEKSITSTRNANFYCQQLNVSFGRLNDISKELTGKTLKKFIDDGVIIKAKQYLLEGDHNISEISVILGFDETTNFTKYFRKHTKQSPKEFRNIISKERNP